MMKKNEKLVWLTSFILMLVFSSCSKNNDLKDPEVNTYNLNQQARLDLGHVQLDLSRVRNERGRLHFDDLQAYHSLVEQIERYDDQLVIPDDDVDYGEEPIWDEFDRLMSFNSKRKEEEIRENAFLENGGDPFIFDDFYVWDEAISGVLNRDKEFAFGDHIMMSVNEHYFIKIPIREDVLYQQLRRNDISALANEAVEIVPFDGLTEDNLIVANFNYSYENSAIVLAAVSKSKATINRYIWNIDGQVFNTTSPNFNFPVDYNTIGHTKICLAIVDVDGAVGNICQNMPPPYHCDADFNFVVAPNLTEELDVQFYGLPLVFDGQGTDIPESDLNYEWEFGDGQTSTLKDPFHTYATAGTFSAKFKISYYDELGFNCESIQRTKQVSVSLVAGGCCKQLCKVKKEKESVDGNYKIKTKFKVSLGGIFLHRFKAKMKNYKKKNSGGWKRKKTDLEVKVWGTFWNESSSGTDCSVSSVLTESNTPHVKEKYGRKIKLQYTNYSTTGWVKKNGVSAKFLAAHGNSVTQILSKLHEHDCD